MQRFHSSGRRLFPCRLQWRQLQSESLPPLSSHQNWQETRDAFEDPFGTDDDENPAEITRQSSHLRDQHVQKRASVSKWTGLIMLSRTPDQVAHTLFESLPEEAFKDARVWATILNVFKRHELAGGINWVLNEMRERRMPFTPDILGNLLSAYGHLKMPVKAAKLWTTMPEVANSTGHLRAKLLSITAVALARNGMYFDKEVNEAMETLKVRDPNPIEYNFWYSWGRLMHAFVLVKNMPGAERVFEEYQNLMPIKEYTPLNLYNTMIRGYGDVGNLDKAFKMFDEAQDVTGRIDAETEMDMVMVIDKCCGIDGSVEFLVREGSFDDRPEPFQRLLAMLLDRGDLKNAKLLFGKMVTHSEDELEISVDEMRSKVTLSEDRLKKHPLWKENVAPQFRKISWMDVLLRVPSATALERVLQTGMIHLSRTDCQRLLKRCEVIGCAAGVGLLFDDRMKVEKNTHNIWTLGLGVEVLQRLGNIRTRRNVSAKIASQCATLATRITKQWLVNLDRESPTVRLHLKLLKLYATGPVDVEAERVELFEDLPKTKEFFVSLRPADFVRAVTCLVERDMMDSEYVECVLAFFGDRTLNVAVDTFSDVMVLLVPRFVPLEEISMMNNPKFELSYWNKVVRRASSAKEARRAVEKCLLVKEIDIHAALWLEWAEAFARLLSADDLDWLELKVPNLLAWTLLVPNAKCDGRSEAVHRIYNDIVSKFGLSDMATLRYQTATYLLYRNERRAEYKRTRSHD